MTGHAIPTRVQEPGFYTDACPECDGKVLIEDGVYWPEVEATNDRACALCGGQLEDDDDGRD